MYLNVRLIVELTKLLLAASSSVPEVAIRRHLEGFEGFAGIVGFVDGNRALKRFVQEFRPDAETVKAQTPLSARKAMAAFDHLILLWDGDDLASLLFEARFQKKKTKLITIQVTRVVNKKKTNDYDVYIGRGSPWGNPYAIGNGEGPDRAEVIERYKTYFEEKIASDEGFKKGVLAMRGLRLACFCKPEACHGDVIAGYLDRLPDEPEGTDASQ